MLGFNTLPTTSLLMGNRQADSIRPVLPTGGYLLTSPDQAWVEGWCWGRRGRVGSGEQGRPTGRGVQELASGNMH